MAFEIPEHHIEFDDNDGYVQGCDDWVHNELPRLAAKVAFAAQVAMEKIAKSAPMTEQEALDYLAEEAGDMVGSVHLWRRDADNGDRKAQIAMREYDYLCDQLEKGAL